MLLSIYDRSKYIDYIHASLQFSLLSYISY